MSDIPDLSFDRALLLELRRGRTWRQAVREYARSISALLLRETATRFGNRRLGYVWAFFEPLAFILIFVGIRALISTTAPFGESIALFMISGLLSVRVILLMSGSMSGAISANKALLTYPSVRPLDSVVARLILEVLTNLIIVLIVYAGLAFVVDGKIVQDPVGFTSATLATLYLGATWGVLNAAVTPIWPFWQSLSSIIRLPLLLVSGVFFMPAFFSPEIQAVLWWNPVMHCVEWYRVAIYLDYIPVLDRAYPFIFGTIMLVLALWIERTYRLRIAAL